MILSFSVSRLFQPLMPLMIVSYTLVIFPYPYGMKRSRTRCALAAHLRRLSGMQSIIYLTARCASRGAFLCNRNEISYYTKRGSRIFSPAPPSESLFPILPLFQRNPENKCIHASDQGSRKLRHGKVVWNTAIFASIGAGRRFGIRISEITIPMNSAFTTDPAAMPAISPPFPFAFFVTSPTPKTRRALPAMIHGMIAGMAPMIGLPVIKNDVTGVITERIMPQGIPHT